MFKVNDKVKCIKYVDISNDEKIYIGFIYEIGAVVYDSIRLKMDKENLSVVFYPSSWFEKVKE